MIEEKRRILNMLSEGKITPEEAERLLDALRVEGQRDSAPASTGSAPVAPKYLRVLVEGDHGPHGGKVNVRIPMNLIRAGVRLAALLPATAYDPINRALKENGVNIDVSQLKPDDLEDLVRHLAELSVDVEGNQGEKVRVFCE